MKTLLENWREYLSEDVEEEYKCVARFTSGYNLDLRNIQGGNLEAVKDMIDELKDSDPDITDKLNQIKSEEGRKAFLRPKILEMYAEILKDANSLDDLTKKIDAQLADASKRGIRAPHIEKQKA